MSWRSSRLWGVAEMSLTEFLQRNAIGQLVSGTVQQQLMARFELSGRDAEEQILQLGYLPARYQRNQQMISTEQQLGLHQSRVAVVGCGGLGGYILEELARLGVGTIVAIDPDVFEEHNLNRQLLSSASTLGAAKVDIAVQRLAEVNPAVVVCPFADKFTRQNGASLLEGVELAIDAVDNIQARLDLEACCEKLNLPLVHGAIAGWFGQLTSIFPGDRTLQKVYAHWSEGPGVESDFGNPSFTPAVLASLQVAEACKILLGQGDPVRNGLLSINLLNMQFEQVPF